MDFDRASLRHAVATLGYRAAKPVHGAPMKSESYNRADIVSGRIGLEQQPADPRFEFD